MKSRHKLDVCKSTGKKCHPCYYSAAQHLKRQVRGNHEGVGTMNVFRCKDCGAWHIGHNRQRIKG